MRKLRVPAPRDEDVVILCGGRGTRLQQAAGAIPKPLVEIGGRPIVWHVIQIYAAHTYKDAVTLNDLWRFGAPWATSPG